MNETTFAHLLQQREGETLEFKRELPGSSDLAVLISAFYNTRGGTIIVGVDDQRQPVGLLRPQSVEAGITHILRDRLDLDVLPAIEIVPYDGREFVVVTCPRGLYPPYFVRGEPMAVCARRLHQPAGHPCRNPTALSPLRRNQLRDVALSHRYPL